MIFNEVLFIELSRSIYLEAYYHDILHHRSPLVHMLEDTIIGSLESCCELSISHMFL